MGSVLPIMCLVVVIWCWFLVPGAADLQDLVNSRMFSCVRDVAFCRAHSPNLRNNIWNFVFSKLYTPDSNLYTHGPAPRFQEKEEEADEGVEVEVYDSDDSELLKVISNSQMNGTSRARVYADVNKNNPRD